GQDKLGHWIFGQVFCKVTRFGFNLNLYGSIGFLTCISVYRYLSIVHPLRVMGRINWGHSVVIAVLVWVLVGAQSLPDMFYEKTSKNSRKEKCYDTTTSDFYMKDYLNYIIAWTVCGFCVPLLIILSCYGHVAVVLNTKTNIDQVMKQRCLKLVFTVTLLFSVCYIPYHIFKILSMKTRILQKEGTCQDWFSVIYVAKQASRALVCLNSAINPLIYLHGDEEINTQITRLCRRARQSVSEIHVNRQQAPITNSKWESQYEVVEM
ncbi:hypothetical protein UPYG_G00002500, partial [Umbra pygmaea]